jgi:hypothetical protein
MQVLESREALFHYHCCLLLSQGLPLDHKIEEFTAFTVTEPNCFIVNNLLSN